jgi:hypothetical protein
MKFLLLILLFPVFSFGQFRKLDTLPPGGYSKKVLKIERKNHQCVKLQKKEFAEILKQYPYNSAAKVQLVSFKAEKLPIENDTVNYSKLFEVIDLSFQQIDSLTNIIYNIGFGGTILIVEELSCYNPRNGIIFIDSKGLAFEYIEICFECEQIIANSDKIDFGEICNEKFNLIKQQFNRAGIKHGTSNIE